MISLKQTESFRGHPADHPFVHPVEAIQKVSNQKLDVLEARPQRRDRDGNDIQAVVKVFPESPLFDRLLQIPIGCRNHADIHRSRLGTADAFKDTFLQYPQKLYLNVQAQLTHFIEKNRAFVCQFKTTGTSGDRSRECPLLVTKKFAFKQTLRDRPATDG